MPAKVIEVAAPADRVRAVTAVAEDMQVSDLQVAPSLADGRQPIRMVVGETDRQTLLDRLQGALGPADSWRVVIMPADAVLPREPDDEDDEATTGDEEEREADKERASREELHSLVASGVHMDWNFILLVFLSTVVAAVGLGQDSAAVVIGAMVIAPLLGPNVAFAFATAIGDRTLMLSAMRSSVFGIALSVLIAAALSLVVDPDLTSDELMARTSLDYSGIILALASGAAAALSVTTGLSATLVGVMVAVALLPPAATVGIMATGGRPDLAMGAAMLLGANIACINLSAQVVFVLKGVQPRLWYEKKSARKAVTLSLATWFALLMILVALIYIRQSTAI